VPANRAAELSTELAPVLALLADTHAECGRIAAAARWDAERIADNARQQAAALAAGALERARAAREATIEQVLAAARTEAEEAVSAAQTQASRQRARFTASQADHLAAMAVGMLRSLPGRDGQR